VSSLHSVPAKRQAAGIDPSSSFDPEHWLVLTPFRPRTDPLREL
jgi:hypothetical protein